MKEKDMTICMTQVLENQTDYYMFHISCSPNFWVWMKRCYVISQLLLPVIAQANQDLIPGHASVFSGSFSAN